VVVEVAITVAVTSSEILAGVYMVVAELTKVVIAVIVVLNESSAIFDAVSVEFDVDGVSDVVASAVVLKLLLAELSVVDTNGISTVVILALLLVKLSVEIAADDISDVVDSTVVLVVLVESPALVNTSKVLGVETSSVVAAIVIENVGVLVAVPVTIVFNPFESLSFLVVILDLITFIDFLSSLCEHNRHC
jgi:hypothetical protein